MWFNCTLCLPLPPSLSSYDDQSGRESLTLIFTKFPSNCEFPEVTSSSLSPSLPLPLSLSSPPSPLLPLPPSLPPSLPPLSLSLSPSLSLSLSLPPSLPPFPFSISPGPPLTPMVDQLATQPRGVSVQITPPFSLLNITNYSVRITEVSGAVPFRYNSTTPSFTVPGLTPFTSYSLVATAINRAGSSDPSSAQLFRTSEDGMWAKF